MATVCEPASRHRLGGAHVADAGFVQQPAGVPLGSSAGLEKPQRSEGGIRVRGEGNCGGGGIEAAAAAAEVPDGLDFVLGTDTSEAEAALAGVANGGATILTSAILSTPLHHHLEQQEALAS